jgi:hypothetical protein
LKKSTKDCPRVFSSKKHSKNRSIVNRCVTTTRPGPSDRAKNQPICQGVARFLAICFGPDIDENVFAKVSLFVGTTITSPSSMVQSRMDHGWQMRKNRKRFISLVPVPESFWWWREKIKSANRLNLVFCRLV